MKVTIEAIVLGLIITTIGCGPKTPPSPSTDSTSNEPAETQEAEVELPSADSLFSRNLEALGGIETLETAQNTSAVIQISIPLAGMNGTMNIFSENGERLYVAHSLPGASEGQTVVDGDLGWSVDSLTGPRIIEGDELLALKMDNDPLAAAHYGDWYPVRETMELTEFNNEPAYLVVATTDWGKEDRIFFSVESGLAIGSTTTQLTAVGEMQVTTEILEYAEFSGIQMPSIVSQTTGAMKILMTLENMEVNPVIDPELWVPPAEIVELMEEFQGDEE